MMRIFIPNQDHVQIISDIHEVNEYGSRNGRIIQGESNTKCHVIAYNERGTENKVQDDIVKLKIDEIDPGYEEHEGYTFWVAQNEFSKLRKI